MAEADAAAPLNFDNLPLVEAAVRVSFQQQAALSYKTVNAVAERLKSTFRSLSEPLQFEIAPGVESEVQFGPTHLPGAVYGGNEHGLTASLTAHVIVVRWVRELGPIARAYPRYARMRETLWATVEAFRTALGDAFPGISVVNMSYINFLQAVDPSAVVVRYLAPPARLGIMAAAAKVRKLEAAWNEGGALDVRFALEQAKAKLAASVEDGYKLTTAAGVVLSEALNAQAGLDQVHLALQSLFGRLISDLAKAEWRLQEDARA